MLIWTLRRFSLLSFIFYFLTFLCMVVLPLCYFFWQLFITYKVLFFFYSRTFIVLDFTQSLLRFKKKYCVFSLVFLFIMGQKTQNIWLLKILTTIMADVFSLRFLFFLRINPNPQVYDLWKHWEPFWRRWFPYFSYF